MTCREFTQLVDRAQLINAIADGSGSVVQSTAFAELNQVPTIQPKRSGDRDGTRRDGGDRMTSIVSDLEGTSGRK